MSLSDSISSLRQAFKAETPTQQQLSEIGELWTEAHQHALRGKLLTIQQKAEAEIQTAAANAKAALMAQIQHAEDAARAAAAASVAQAKVTEAVPATEAPIAPSNSTHMVTEHEAIPAPVTPVSPVEASVAEEVTETTLTPPASETQLSQAPAARETAPAAPAPSAPIPAANPSSPSQTRSLGAAKSVNARYAGLKVGLNDRVAFVKHLFNGEDDDFQRVVAALATMESKEECETFLENAVYPDYDWTQKPEYAERFLALVFARFE